MLSAPMPQFSPERLMQFTFGFAPPLMIERALRYGVFDILDKGAKSLDALCTETGTSLGPPGADGADSYVLGEINVSSVFPIPAEAPAEIASRVADRLRSNR
jgi:hypothetical protein